jgi:hypothetical protein
VSPVVALILLFTSILVPLLGVWMLLNYGWRGVLGAGGLAAVHFVFAYVLTARRLT